MEPITIITTAMEILTPFFMKTGEKFGENIGESLWTWIKRAFAKNEDKQQLPKLSDLDFQEKLKALLVEKINLDKKFKKELQHEVENAQKDIKANYQQNIENKGDIEKQIIIQENNGNI